MPPPAREWRPPGPVDLALECLVDDDLDALLSVVGVTGPAQRLDGVLPAQPLTAHLLTPTELGIVPVEVDLPAPVLNADVLARTPAGIVQLEFVVDRVPPDLGLDLLDYWIRLREQDREIPIEQFAVVLADGCRYRTASRTPRCPSAGLWCRSPNSTRRPCCAAPPRRRSRRWLGARPRSERRRSPRQRT
ncbi:MAG: hypothetical protein ACT4NY_05770 [Pseudonocardiales bacterium]